MTTDFEALRRAVAADLYIEGSEVEVGEWQSLRGQGTPMETTYELIQKSIRYPMPSGMVEAQQDIEPNLPWAEDHFQERVSGYPLNPGMTYEYWPWYKGKEGQGVEEHKAGGRFSHTYMERYWPKHATEEATGITRRRYPHRGIRYDYGDLQDLVSLLSKSPYTRQAYLPVWFPEDTGAVHGERVPCSLGYHFLLRNGLLHCEYSIRSCDFFRHFHNDVYLTVRLVQWVAEKLSMKDAGIGYRVVPGTLKMNIGSLHVFSAELRRLEKESRPLPV